MEREETKGRGGRTVEEASGKKIDGICSYLQSRFVTTERGQAI